MKKIRRYGEAGTLAFVVLTVARSAWACDDPSETFVTKVSRTFSAGSAWNINLSRRTCEGLAIGEASYRPAGGTNRQVLNKGTLSEVHVTYHTGSPRFLDVTESSPGLGATAVPLAPEECPDGTLYDGNRICVRTDDDGYGWKSGTSFRRAQAIEIFISSQIGQYNYINRWTFRDDGTIEPSVGLTGKLQSYGFSAAHLPYGSRTNPAFEAAPRIAKSHMHSFYYRLDFDIDGADNDAVRRVTFHPSRLPGPETTCSFSGECGINLSTPILVEAAQFFSPFAHTSWVVFDKRSLNSDGRSIGYELVPHIKGLWRGMTTTSEPWSNAELWVTAYDNCERYVAANHPPHLDTSCGLPARNLSAMVDGDSVDGQDLVVWYTQRLQHIPRDEDEVTMPIEWTSFEIQPRNFHLENPAP